jgi:hypothetical protein
MDELTFRFKEDTHQYFLGDDELISVTTLMRKHGLAPSYDGVPSAVLKAKAERGSLIHEEIEQYIKQNEIGFTLELQRFINYTNGTNTEILKSEFYVYNNIVAGTVDLLLYKGGYIIADIKTTATLHKEAVSWQLSIYAYLLEQINPSIKVAKGQAYHFNKDGELNVVDIELKPFNEVARLLECERLGTLYKQELTVNDAQLTELAKVEAIIKQAEEQKKQAEEQAKELRAAIMEAMEKNGVKKFENERIAITYVEPTTRSSLDTTKLKKDMPEVAEKYTKTSNIKASYVSPFTPWTVAFVYSPCIFFSKKSLTGICLKFGFWVSLDLIFIALSNVSPSSKFTLYFDNTREKVSFASVIQPPHPMLADGKFTSSSITICFHRSYCICSATSSSMESLISSNFFMVNWKTAFSQCSYAFLRLPHDHS